jgi:hypothetical protein
MPVFSEWESFYVIVGSSAGALIGLQFVVFTLIAESPTFKDMKRASSAFSTPNIIHSARFCCCRPFLALHGRDSRSSKTCGERWALPESFTRSSWCDE